MMMDKQDRKTRKRETERERVCVCGVYVNIGGALVCLEARRGLTWTLRKKAGSIKKMRRRGSISDTEACTTTQSSLERETLNLPECIRVEFECGLGLRWGENSKHTCAHTYIHIYTHSFMHVYTTLFSHSFIAQPYSSEAN